MFYLLGFGALVSALLLVTNRKPVAAAISLIMTMLCLSGIYVILDAHLIAVLQIIVYAGAIMVLFLFVIMLLNVEEKSGRLSNRKIALQFVGILIVGSTLVAVAGLIKIDPAQVTNGFGTTKAIGQMLFTDFLLPFEIASILLLAAIVGAVVLAKRRIEE